MINPTLDQEAQWEREKRAGEDCARYVSGEQNGLQVGTTFCRGPDSRKYDPRMIRRAFGKCGPTAE